MIRINLLPVRAARRKENIRQQVSIFFLSILLVFGIMFYLAIHLGKKISHLNAEIEQAQGELTLLQAKSRQADKIKAELDKLEAKLGIIETLEANRSGPVRIMDALTSLVVAKKMWVTSLSETGGKMSFAGVAVDNKTIADFMKRLEGSPYFGEVDLISSNQVVMGEGRKFKGFSITCQTLISKPSTEPKT